MNRERRMSHVFCSATILNKPASNTRIRFSLIMGPMPKPTKKWGKAKIACTICRKLRTEESMKQHWRQTHRGIPYQTIPGASVEPAATTAKATVATSIHVTGTNTTAPNTTATYVTPTNATATHATAPYTAASKTIRTVTTADDDGGEGVEQGFGDSGFEEELDDGLGGAPEDGLEEPMSMTESVNEDCGLSSKTRADVLITSSCRHDTFPNAGSPKVFLIT